MRWLEILRSFVRNLTLFGQMWRYATTREPTRRLDSISRVHEWAEKRRRHARRKASESHLVGFPREILTEYRGIRDHLASTPHLGILQDISDTSLSRFDYVCEQAELLHDVQKTFPGIGLSHKVPLDGIRTPEKISGLELCQLWTVLASFGHLFGTFATERALLFFLKEDQLLKPLLQQIDDGVRNIAIRLLKSNSMYEFVHVVGLWRICRMDSESLIRGACLEAYRLLLCDEPTPRVVRLREIYRTMRRLAYLRLHEELAVGEFRSALFTDRAVFELIDHGAVAFDAAPEFQTPFRKLLAAMDTYQYETFFTGAHSALAVLQHLGEFKSWWRIKQSKGVPVEELIDDLFACPSDWPTIPLEKDLTPFVRLEVPQDEARWINEVREWRSNGASWDDGSNFFVSCAPGGKRLHIDLYFGAEICTRGMHQSARMLARHCANTWKNNHPDNGVVWRSVGEFGLALLHESLDSSCKLRLLPSDAGERNKGFAGISTNIGALRRRVTKFTEQVVDQNRKVELEAFLELSKGWQHDAQDVFLVFLGSVFLLNESTGNRLGDVDVLAARIGPTSVTWLFGEVKTGKQTGAAGELGKIRSLLRNAVPGEICRSGTTRFKIASFEAWTEFRNSDGIGAGSVVPTQRQS